VNGKPCCSPQRAGPGSAAKPLAANEHARPAQARHGDLVALAGGTFAMGDAFGEAYPGDGEGPVRLVVVTPFHISATAVTNAQFNDFVRATGYITQAEEAGSSFVFYLQASQEVRDGARGYPHGMPWWIEVPDACWQRPHGPGTRIEDRMDHPVVHVSWHDARAYCDWAGARLPTEAEWEYAARGGLEGKRYAWGDEMPAEPPCNIWRGEFPNHPAPHWAPGTAGVRSFPANGHGLYEMAGNVWEWCDGEFHAGSGARAMRGGSFLCHDSYCNRYRVSARSSNTPESSSGNIGFRVAA
jgi:sulfatase modifying factor 1